MSGAARGEAGGWPDVVPVIEAVAPGVEAVVIPSGISSWLAEAMPVRAYIVDGGPPPGGRGPVILIDAGYDLRLAVEAISTAVAGRRVEAIALTHGHPDHAGGAAQLAARHGAPVRMAPAETASFGAPPDLAFEPLTDGDELRVGSLRLRAVATPGHTRGHICLHEPDRGWLFSGDTVLGAGTVVVGPPDGDMQDYLASLERLQRLAPLERILPGHGDPIDEPARRLESLVRHRRMRIHQVEALLQAGPLTAADAVAALYQGQVPDELLGLAQVSAAGSLELLVAEGKAVAEAGGRYRAAGPGDAPATA